MNIGENLNLLIYALRRYRWVLKLGGLARANSRKEIRSPIFLLGTQGSGLTLLSRMLRRNQKVVSVSGNHTYWSGADEMQNVLWPVLPPELTGLRFKAPADEVFGTPRGWLYATDRLLPKYRLTADDAQPELAERLARILRWLLAWHGAGIDKPRFTDKSQVLTVKLSFLDALLKGTDPCYVLVTRNPYALCFRSALGKANSLAVLDNSFSLTDKVELAAQHWANSMRCALADAEKVARFMCIRFEDLLQAPNETLESVCSFLGLEFYPEMLPQPDDEIPWGSRFRDRWYPLRPEVNGKYLERIQGVHAGIIEARCGELAKSFGYSRPK